MDVLNRLNLKTKLLDNTGFGTSASSYGGRFINKDGSANVKKEGSGIFTRISWYHTMLDMPRWKFLVILFSFFISVNFIFACIYYYIGIVHLVGIDVNASELEKFGKAYFFSTQTFTTVGYGHISPDGFLTSALSAVEALIGLLSFAIATGLFFGRFSKPSIFLKFSENALIAPYKDGTALMFRITPFKNTNYMNAKVNVTLGMSVEENGKLINKFYILDLEIEKINSFVLSWTLVHAITKDSPLYKLKTTDFATIHGEILVIVNTFDDMYSSTVAARTSYTFEEIIYGARFIPMYTRSHNKKSTILNLDKLNHYDKVVLKD